MKAIKLIVKILVCLVVAVVAIVLTLPLWIGPVAKTVTNTVAPKITKTHVHLGDFGLNFYTGNFHMGDFQLENPAGYSQREAATLGQIEVQLDPLSVASDVIHIRLIRIKDVFASYVSKDGVNNIDQILENAGVKGGEEAAKPEEKPAEKKPADEKPAKKVIIDRFELSGVMVQLGPIPLPVPPLTLNDIGKKSGGATLEEAWNQVFEAVMKSAGVLGEQLQALGGLVGDGAKRATEAATKAAGQATEAAAKAAGQATEAATKAVSGVTDGAGKIVGGATDAVSGAASSVGEGAGKIVGGATDAVSGAASTVGEGAGKAVDAVGDGAKAVGEGAKKALDSLKSLW